MVRVDPAIWRAQFGRSGDVIGSAVPSSSYPDRFNAARDNQEPAPMKIDEEVLKQTLCLLNETIFRVAMSPSVKMLTRVMSAQTPTFRTYSPVSTLSNLKGGY